MTVPYTFGTESSPIPLSQLDANFAAIPAFANTAGNVSNAAQPNITSVGTLTSLSVAGNVSVANISITNSTDITGNASAGNISTSGIISAYGTVVGGSFSTVGNITANNISATTRISTSGNIVGGNVSATGNILAQGQISATGNIVTAQYFIGNFQGNITGNLSVGGSNTQILFNNNGNVGAAGGLTYNSGSNTLAVLGNITAQNLQITGTTQLVGVATGPTAPSGTANNQLATTAFVNNFVGALGTMASQNAVSVAISGGTVSNVILGGLITAPTPANGTSNTQVATTSFVVNNAIPSGGIIMWSGNVSAIPSGWNLCDGTNSTPDLRGRFVVGVSPAYPAASTGGSANAIVVAHTHSITDPGHLHYSTAGGAPNGGGAGACLSNGQGAGGPQPTQAAATGISVNSVGSSGTNANLPPYYALAYIMKV